MKGCADCIHVSTPKGMQCHTMTRRLKELVEDVGDPFTPEFVIPAMDRIADECKRYKMNNDDIENDDTEIEHGGMVKTIGEMVSDLTTGHASYWHWHTLFSKVIRLYDSAKNEEGYGILLPDELIVNGKSIGLLETEIANGVYNRDCLFKIVHIHKFLFTGDAF